MSLEEPIKIIPFETQPLERIKWCVYKSHHHLSLTCNILHPLDKLHSQPDHHHMYPHSPQTLLEETVPVEVFPVLIPGTDREEVEELESCEFILY
jgi:hypothetical protein